MNRSMDRAHEAIDAAARESMKRYAMVIEWSDVDRKYITTIPDLPGCVTAGETREEAARAGEEAMVSYLGSVAQHGDPVPDKSFTALDEPSTPERLQARRHALGLSQRQLAARLGVSASTVSHWEQGVQRIPAHVMLALNALAAASA